MTRGFLLLVVLLTQFGTCGAATYYVSPTGDNANSGLTRTNAWATLQRAVDATLPGDTVAVLSGTYAGARIETSGAPAAPITLRPDTGATVVVNTPGVANRRNGVIEIETWSGSGVVSHWIVEGLHVQNSPRYGIDARSSQFVTIRGNVVSNAFSTGIFTPFCYDLVVEHNTSCDNGEHGIYHNNSSDRFAIRNNHCFGNTHAGIHLNGDLSVPPPGGTPWVWDGTISDGLIENNVIHDNGTGGAGINMDGVTDTIVRNNLLYRTWNNSGIAIFHGNGAVASQRNQILNNIVVMAQGAGWCLNIASSGSVSNRVFNNIFFHPSTADGSIVIATAALQGFACDYNSLASRFSLDNDNSRTTLTVWRAAGYDTHSIVASLDDLFVDNVVNNYRLKATSPAIDRGTAQPSAPVDRDGVPRPLDGDANAVSAWDLGAYEFVHATVDTDQDGFPDRSEQIAGTDATNRASYFRITDIRSSTTESRVLTWPSAPGRQYSLSHATNLASPLAPITANIAATPPVNVQTTAVGDAVSGFFRLDVSLTP